MKTTVLYHGGSCKDGWCSAWLASKAYPDAECVPVNYGEPVPLIGHNGRVLIVDFSYPYPELRDLCGNVTELVVLDHHKTAAETLAHFAEENETADGSRPHVVFDTGKSGARLTWEYLQATHVGHEFFWWYGTNGDPKPASVPALVSFVEDRDLWVWKVPRSREVNAAIRSYPMDFDTWDWLNESDLNVFFVEGEAILRAESAVVESHVRNAVPITLDGFSGLVVNATTLISEIGGALAEKADFGLTWFWDGAANVKRYSIRSRGKDGIDVSAVASRRGGGGHPHSAGWGTKEGG